MTTTVTRPAEIDAEIVLYNIPSRGYTAAASIYTFVRVVIFFRNWIFLLDYRVAAAAAAAELLLLYFLVVVAGNVFRLSDCAVRITSRCSVAGRQEDFGAVCIHIYIALRKSSFRSNPPAEGCPGRLCITF